MGQPAARLTDMHVCPMVTPGLPPIPHVGGPIIGPGCPTVLIGGMPAAVMGDMCTCVGPPDTIILGSTGVFFGGKPAARMGDSCAHGGTIVLGCPTVMIGEIQSGSAPPGSTNLASLDEEVKESITAVVKMQQAAITGQNQVAPFEKPKDPPVIIEKSKLAFKIFDTDKNPKAGIKYEITLPDGSLRSGKTDANGEVHIEGIKPGECKVSFQEIHGEEWW